MLTELRRYTILPGQMDAMHARMTGMLFPLFEAQGIPRPQAIWETRRESSTLSWLVEWPDFETRQDGWARIAPHFAAARQAEGTPEFVTRTTLTLIAPWAGHTIGFADQARCETAWFVQPRIGFGLAFAAACQDGAFDIFRTAGASRVHACNFLFGPLPQAMVLLGWPDAETRRDGIAKLRAEAMPPPLGGALLGDGDRFADRGDWETFDRAPYLARV